MTPQEALDKYLIGRRIKSATAITLTLDDGTTLALYESAYDCCAGATGTWEIIDPSRMEAAITNVEYQEASSYDGDTNVTRCTITILHNQTPLALGEGRADAGNGGYYFSVLSLLVEVNGQEVYDEAVIEA